MSQNVPKGVAVSVNPGQKPRTLGKTPDKPRTRLPGPNRLQRDLDALAASNPAVKAAADEVDRVADRIITSARLDRVELTSHPLDPRAQITHIDGKPLCGFVGCSKVLVKPERGPAPKFCSEAHRKAQARAIAKASRG